MQSDSGRCGTSFRSKSGLDDPNGGHAWRASRRRARLSVADSIKGLAQSIAKPAYRRLLTAEPALRRAVPALIIAFLVTICIGAFVQVFDHRRQAIGEVVRGMTGSAEFLADRLGRSSRRRRPPQAEPSSSRSIPAWALVPGRQILLTNADGVIVAAVRVGVLHRRRHDHRASRSPTRPRSAAASPTFSDHRSHWTLWGPWPACWRSPSPTARRPTRRCIGSAPGRARSAIVHRRADALAAWRSDTALTVTLSATTGFVVLILGFAFHWQATRAREADVIYETVRTPHRHRAQPRPLRAVGLGPRRAAASSGRIRCSRSWA